MLSGEEHCLTILITAAKETTHHHDVPSWLMNISSVDVWMHYFFVWKVLKVFEKLLFPTNFPFANVGSLRCWKPPPRFEFSFFLQMEGIDWINWCSSFQRVQCNLMFSVSFEDLQCIRISQTFSWTSDVFITFPKRNSTHQTFLSTNSSKLQIFLYKHTCNLKSSGLIDLKIDVVKVHCRKTKQCFQFLSTLSVRHITEHGQIIKFPVVSWLSLWNKLYPADLYKKDNLWNYATYM